MNWLIEGLVNHCCGISERLWHADGVESTSGNPIHAALASGGIRLHPFESLLALLRVLAVKSGPFVTMGLVEREIIDPRFSRAGHSYCR